MNDENKETIVDSLVGYLPKVANQLLDDIVPKFECITASSRSHIYYISTPPIASALACAMSGDSNLRSHIGPSGFTHTLMLIAMCATAASNSLPGYRLVKIDKVEFRQSLPLGQTMKIRVTLPEKIRRGANLTLEAWSGEDFDSVMLEEHVLTMIRVRKDSSVRATSKLQPALL